MTMDAIEALTNAVIGLAASWLVTWAVLGFSPAASAGITGMFFGLSTVRTFVLRRVFRRIGRGRGC
ncbi:hypothetical protein pben1_p30 [Paracoccus phage vB_PbeS_Pben1]|uniref:Uncharacterized protein n=1 Tax=Paracoccus versutus TaxID=34007 RepID=A0A3D9XZD3_PARVE|nr:hypothetical protein [Paracoccus versutus]AZV00187.1 hypothetical protein pben1_p30 [Paracoccus phage vB_PbeS_Pben1]REF72299.1 hypothetical protein BDD41_0768 [Paracoccus versutus]WGR55718.1 hypothetical protein E3U25_07010 [Paracoccus versutus]